MRFQERAAFESCGLQRWAEASEAVRVICFYGGEDIPVYALLAYAKSARTDLNPAERHQVARIAAAITRARKDKP